MPRSGLRAWGSVRLRRHPVLGAAALLLVALLALLASLELSYAPPPQPIFSTEIHDSEVLIRRPMPLAPPESHALSQSWAPVTIEFAATPGLPVAQPSEPRLITLAGPTAARLPLSALPTTAVPGRPPPSAATAPRALTASAPRALPMRTLAAAAQPSTPVARGDAEPLAKLQIPPAPAAVPPVPLATAAGGVLAASSSLANRTDERPRVAIVLWGLGRSREASEAAIRLLPGEITLGLTPDGSDLQFWADRARAAGHEVLLEVPMEPLSYPQIDPGKQALLTTLPEAENRRRLERLLGAFRGYVGITNFMGSRFTTSEAHLRPVLETLKRRDLIFLDSRANDDSIAYRLAGEIGLDRALNNRYIDNQASAEAIDARLAELTEVALRQGAAVGIGLPQAITIERLARWIPRLSLQGLDLMPLSAVIDEGKRE